jgi:hypothetical protein
MTKIVCGLRSNHFVSPAFALIAPRSSPDGRISMGTTPSQQSNKARLRQQKQFTSVT